MKTKLVKRYWCDHCNRAGLQAGAMRKHEQHCTMNPARSCRVCVLLETASGDERGAPLVDLMALLPDFVDYEYDSHGNETGRHRVFMDQLLAAVPILRKAAKYCPACMMAALRQKKIPVPMVEGFNFKAEMQQIFSDMKEFGDEQRGY